MDGQQTERVASALSDTRSFLRDRRAAFENDTSEAGSPSSTVHRIERLFDGRVGDPHPDDPRCPIPLRTAPYTLHRPRWKRRTEGETETEDPRDRLL